MLHDIFLLSTKISHTLWWHNKIQDYLLTILYFLAGILLIKIWQHFVINKASGLLPVKIKYSWRQFANSLTPLLYLLLLYTGLQLLTFPQKIDHIIDMVAIVVLGIYLIRGINTLLDYFIKYHLYSNNNYTNSSFNLQTFSILSKILIWIIGIIILADNLGFKITPLLAGLGIGGVAVALAAQTLLKDLFSCFAIYFDRPFNIGDFIIVGEFLGTVEYVGIKTTRLRSLGGEELILANSDLTDSRIRNYKRMQRRRVSFNIKVTYNTPLEKLKLIPLNIEKIIKNIDNALFDRAHLANFDDYGFSFEIVYYVLSDDYNKYMDLQQLINFSIIEYFTTQTIAFAQFWIAKK